MNARSAAAVPRPIVPAGRDARALEPEGAAVLGKALARASALLGLTQREVATAIGTSDATVSRVFAGHRGIDPATKEGELAALLLRVYRSLDALVGGDDSAARAWLRADNAHLGAAPVALLVSVEGLVRVAEYLDAMRGHL
jgi:transcriptional regulator with XRE-family HTH domain